MRYINTVVVAIGDMTVFAMFVIIGKAEHEINPTDAFIRTALPFALVWFASSPWLGAYNVSTLNSFRKMIWKIPPIWLFSGLVVLLTRAVLTDRPLTLAFGLVAIAVQGVLLVSWRCLFMMVTYRFTRP